MKKERAIPMILSVALALCLVGCGNTVEQEQTAENGPIDFSDLDISAPVIPSTQGNTNASGESTLGEQNALEKALSYLNYSSFSRTGLIEQLEYEGFSAEEATYGADNCGADWNEQAAKKAQSYLDYSSFSRQGLIDQLVFEGFTQEQAEYGVSAVGY